MKLPHFLLFALIALAAALSAEYAWSTEPENARSALVGADAPPTGRCVHLEPNA